MNRNGKGGGRGGGGARQAERIRRRTEWWRGWRWREGRGVEDDGEGAAQNGRKSEQC